jgi:hypothetical protein
LGLLDFSTDASRDLLNSVGGTATARTSVVGSATIEAGGASLNAEESGGLGASTSAETSVAGMVSGEASGSRSGAVVESREVLPADTAEMSGRASKASVHNFGHVAGSGVLKALRLQP